jgi:hypothetical protein
MTSLPAGVNSGIIHYWTEFHETWWNYRYMLLVDPKVFRFVVKEVKVIFLGRRKVTLVIKH